MISTYDWLFEIIEILKQKNIPVSLSEIYKAIQERQNLNLDSHTDWESRVRKKIYIHSSDTDIFTGVSNCPTDLFNSVEGIDQGVWELKDKETSTSLLLEKGFSETK